MWEKTRRFLKSLFRGNSCLAALAVILAACGLFAFDWPQGGVTAESLATQFAQRRGGSFSPSLVFAQAAPVVAAAEGVAVAVIRAPGPDSNRFYSTLGNAVVVNHKDGFITAYGNLETFLLPLNETQVESQALLGVSGSSGWRRSGNGLEFQAADIDQQTAVNPRTLLPRIEKERPLTPPVVYAVNRQNEIFPLQTAWRLAAGQYRLYLAENAGFPYSTSVSVNGAETETIVLNALSGREGRLAVRGNRRYTAQEFYPSENRRFLAELALARGRNTVRVLLTDINKAERQATYTIEVY
jgi:hypothetical protein